MLKGTIKTQVSVMLDAHDTDDFLGDDDHGDHDERDDDGRTVDEGLCEAAGMACWRLR